MHVSGSLETNSRWMAATATVLIAGAAAVVLGLVLFAFAGSNTANVSRWGRNRAMLPIATEVAAVTTLAAAQEETPLAAEVGGLSFSVFHLGPISDAGIPGLEASLSPYNSTCSHDAGQLEYRSYPGALLTEAIPFRIYLPPCYDRTLESYPVIYLLHGSPMDESQWDDLGADEIAQMGMTRGMWGNFILVMPQLPEPLFSMTDGGAGSYEMEMLSGLIPYVDEHFRTRANAEGRFIAGMSRGGVWALEIALLHPEVFNGVAAMSPSLNINPARDAYNPVSIVERQDQLPESIYLNVGEHDAARYMTELLSETLTANHVDHTFSLISGNISTETWQQTLVNVYMICASGWR